MRPRFPMPMPARVLVALGAVSAVEHAVAWACSCVQITDVVETAAQYAQVFVGEVKHAGVGGCDGRARTRFEVVEAFKGVEEGETVKVEHAVDGAACGLLFDDGEQYLVFASRGETNLCAPGGQVQDVQDWIDDLRAAPVD